MMMMMMMNVHIEISKGFFSTCSFSSTHFSRVCVCLFSCYLWALLVCRKCFFLRRLRRYRGCLTGLAAFLYYLGLGYFSSCSSTRLLALVFSAVGWLVAVSVTFSSRRVIVRSGQTGRVHFESSRLVAFTCPLWRWSFNFWKFSAGEIEKNKK